MKLLKDTKELVKKEKAYTAKILMNLEKIEAKKIYTELGYSSLLKYMVKELGYSEKESYLRISAMRLTKKAPEVLKKIKTGDLTLSTASLIQRKAKEEKLSTTQVLKLTSQMQRKPVHTVKRELGFKPQRSIPVSDHLQKKLEQLRAIYGDLSDTELLESAAEAAILLAGARIKKHTKEVSPTKKTRYISQKVKARVLFRAAAKCEHPKCSSGRFLEFDHMQRFSVGGTRDESNIQLLCFNHHRRKSIEEQKFTTQT